MEQHSLKLKLLDSFYDMVTTKKSNLPIYHGNDSKEFVPAYTAENKKVCNPLVADINLPSTHDFIRSLSEDKKVGLAGIAILRMESLWRSIMYRLMAQDTGMYHFHVQVGDIHGGRTCDGRRAVIAR